MSRSNSNTLSVPPSFISDKVLKIGSFGKKELHCRISPDPSNKGTIVFFHGCCSGPFGTSHTNYSLMYDFFVKKGYRVALYESSRKFRTTDAEVTSLAFEEQAIRCFGGKTIEQEIADADSFVRYVLKQNLADDVRDLYFIGFSLGGLLAAYLATTYGAKNIVLFGSAMRFNLESWTPILGDYKKIEPSLKQLTLHASEFAGRVSFYRGTEDTTATQTSAFELFSLFKQAELKNYIELKGENHRFRDVSGSVSQRLMKQLAKQILREFRL